MFIREPPIKIKCIIHVIRYNLKNGGCPVKIGIKTIVANIKKEKTNTYRRGRPRRFIANKTNVKKPRNGIRTSIGSR
jgi:hypothetical protein